MGPCSSSPASRLPARIARSSGVSCARPRGARALGPASSLAQVPQKGEVSSDQRHFLFASPSFELALAADGGCLRVVGFGVDEFDGAALEGERCAASGVVGFDTSLDVACVVYVERFVDAVKNVCPIAAERANIAIARYRGSWTPPSFPDASPRACTLLAGQTRRSFTRSSRSNERGFWRGRVIATSRYRDSPS
jgi:hypothetical protein